MTNSELQADLNEATEKDGVAVKVEVHDEFGRRRIISIASVEMRYRVDSPEDAVIILQTTECI